MKRIILVISFMVIISLFVNAEINHFYEIELAYSFGKVSYTSIEVIPTSSENYPENIPGGYVAEIVDNEREVLYTDFFDIPLIGLYDNIDEETGEINSGGVIRLNETEISLFLPYFENADKINIYDEDVELIFSIDVAPYSKVVTPEKEPKMYKEVPEIETAQEEIKKKVPVNYRLLIISVISLILIIILFLVFKKKMYHRKS